jgi:hypothetical protein
MKSLTFSKKKIRNLNLDKVKGISLFKVRGKQNVYEVFFPLFIFYFETP